MRNINISAALSDIKRMQELEETTNDKLNATLLVGMIHLEIKI